MKKNKDQLTLSKRVVYKRNFVSVNIIQFVNKIRQNLYKQKLIKCEKQLFIAISGGQDSICLLFGLYILQIQMNFHFDCISVNHFWQKSSFFTMLHVSKCSVCFCSAIKLFVPLKEITKHQRHSEEKARHLRHGATQRAAFFYDYAVCTQGHSKSDRVETILFNLMRGTGISGISALPWKKKQKTFSANKYYPTLLDFFEQTHGVDL